MLRDLVLLVILPLQGVIFAGDIIVELWCHGKDHVSLIWDQGVPQLGCLLHVEVHVIEADRIEVTFPRFIGPCILKIPPRHQRISV